ncbi:NAD(P)H-binding protein [Lacibacter sediminis]|uniref:NAD(P)H-binding protein n=1 Tax=Lacibacter sediminis TaxID=2760713 RepID=A0A7G5XJ75_9BACT|nr:NAD(P)H-binding protein [Lacibacter sediminis]QNA45528.1 NAD(P)H-binding protein [Lacibacter sediminis]
MNGQTAVVLGATGLIGSSLVEQLLADDAFSTVRVLVRKPIPIQHPKLEVFITDFSDYEMYRKNLGTGDCIFSCIGTTNANVKGNKLLYRSIDFDIPVNAARFGKEAGFKQFLLVSAIGADARSRIFYSRLKGEVEEMIAGYKFKSFHVFRPSFLAGRKLNERTGETVLTTLFNIFSFLIPSKYKAIRGATVARAMLKAAKEEKEGLSVYYYNEMIA